MPVDITRILGGFDPLSTFDKARTGAEQRGARKFIANNPELSIEDKIARLSGVGLLQDATLVSNRDVNNRRLEQGDRRITNQENQFQQTFGALQSHRAATRALQREAFNLRRAGLTKAEAQQGALKKYLVSQGLPEDQVNLAVDAGQGGALFKATITPGKKTKEEALFEAVQKNPELGKFLEDRDNAKATRVNVSTGGFNVDQGKAAGFADRMIASEKILSDPDVVSAATDPVQSGIAKLGASGVPLTNFAQSEKFQIYDQSKRDFINAILRRESGAVIADSEFENAEKQYFPQVGDSDAVIEQKRQNRKVAIDGVRRAAGPAFENNSNRLRFNPATGDFEE